MSSPKEGSIQLPARTSFPIDFRVEDSDGNAAIYITDDHAADRHLVLVLTNRSGETIRLGPAGPHFELRFRKGVLSGETLQLLATAGGKGVLSAEPGWAIARQDHAEECALNFTCTNPAVFRAESDAGAVGALAPGGSLSLALKQITGDPAGGVRVTHIGFSPRQLFYGDGVAVTGFRRHQLSVLSHLGKPHIPLQVGLVDGVIDGQTARQTILNDGTQNCICLRFTNLHPSQPLKLNPEGTRTPTTLKLTIPTGDKQQAWAVTSRQDAKEIEVKTPWKQVENAIERELGSGSALVFKFVATATELGANKSFDVLLKNIKSNAASGQATLLVEYGNFPGYWSGRFDVPVHKAPLLFSGANVGIRTPTPDHPLSIASKTDVPAFYVKQEGAGPAANFVGSVEVTSKKPDSPTVRIYAESQDNALSVQQASGGRAAHFDGPVQIDGKMGTGRPGLTIETSETFNGPALMARSKNRWSAGYFLGPVYVGTRGPEIGLLTSDCSLYIDAVGKATPLQVFSGPSNKAAFFRGNVGVDGMLAAQQYTPNHVSDWLSDNSATTHTTTFTHNLGYLPAVVMLYFSPTLPVTKIYPVGWTWEANGTANPVTVEVTTGEVVLHIASGYNLHGIYDARTAKWTPCRDGYWRVVLFGTQE